MRPFVFAAVALLGLVAPLYAQNASVSPLERLIDTDFTVRIPMDDCAAPAAVSGLARRYQFLAGAEYLQVDCSRIWAGDGQPRTDGKVVNFRGLTIGDALKKISAMDPRYKWIERDGLIVIRPVQAWADPQNLLNYTSGSFTLDDVNVGGALDVVVSAITGREGGSGALHAERTEQGRRKFSVRAGATSVGEALDAIVRAHGDARWEVRLGIVRPNELGPVIWMWTHDGTGLGTPAVSSSK